MNIFKKIFFIGAIVLGLVISNTAWAMTPTLSFTPDANNSSYVNLIANGDANANVLFRYNSTVSGLQLKYLGTTNASGYFSYSLRLDDLNIGQYSAASVMVNNQASSDVSWPYASSNSSTNTNLTLNQSSTVVNVGQTITINASNIGTNSLYLSNNSNPQAANISFSGNQISVTGLSSGQTTANVCLVNSNSSSNCASIYIIVQNSSAQTLSFSQNTTSIISGQNTQITISGGSGFYKVQNNSNPNIISTNLNGPTLTLYANGTTGSTTVTICSTDMNICGIVNASIGTYTSSSTGLNFNQPYPSLGTGQTLVVSISGGFGTYYLSSNSNANIVQTYLSTSTITLYGNTPGSSSIVICAPSGSCGTIFVTVSASYGGPISLSQRNVSVMAGQVLGVNITGGRIPYNLIQDNDGIVQYSLKDSVVTVTGVRSGSSSATVCSSTGECIALLVSVSSSGTTVSGVQPVFSQNNVAVNANQTASVYLTGNGGYYISNNSNQNTVAASISGSTLVITGTGIGSANVTVCQTGGQCNTVYITVSNSNVSTVTATAITFDKTYAAVSAGENTTVNIAGGLPNANYVSTNTYADIATASLSGNVLTITGKSTGFTSISVCSSTGNCASLFVIVSAKKVTSTTTNINKYVFTKPLKFGMTSNEVKELQIKLKELGYLTATPTGYYGNQTVAAVKKFQKAKGLEQLGTVGPGTRAALNK